MSGHSKWSTIRHKKGAADVKRGKIFTKIIREITVAAKIGGGDINTNPRLRLAINKAKSENMPKDNMEKAIKKGTGELEGVNYEENIYEGYGPNGVAIMVSTLTDNKNRTISEIRHIFSKNGGNIGATGCVAFLFDRKGVIVVLKKDADEEKLMDIALNAGAEDIREDKDFFEIITDTENFENVKESIENAKIPYENAEITMLASDSITLKEKEADQMMKLMDALDDCDDVQDFYTNADFLDSE